MEFHKGMSNTPVFIYADESCLGVQFTDRDSPGGAGGLVEMWHGDQWRRRDYWISEPATTNNRMAIRGAIVGLEELKKPCRVIFVSDSQYLVRAMSGWVHSWKRAGWKRKTGALENAELWQELDRAARRHEVTWQWVRGHAGHAQNEYANHLATRAAKKQNTSSGLVESEFVKWLEEQREKYDKYMDFNEWQRPQE
jgi:ribonuclease HI